MDLVVFQQPRPPELEEHARLDPVLEAVMGGGGRADAGGREGLPLAAGAQDEQDAVEAVAVSTPGPSAAEAVGVLVRRQQGLDLGPEFIGNEEGTGRLVLHGGF